MSLMTLRRLSLTACLLAAASLDCPAAEGDWKPLWNEKDLAEWDTYLGPPQGESSPIGLNKDPRSVFSVVEVDGKPALRISGEIYGALTTREEFEDFHFRIEFKWGQKRWPPRATVGRDTGVLYNCVGPHGAGSGAWMKSIECNVMEKGCGQWWSVAGSIADFEGERVNASNEHLMPYRMEGPGERLILNRKGGELFTASPGDGVTPGVDPEKPHGEWNTVEVVCMGSTGIHVVNGKVNLVLTRAGYREGDRFIPLTRGKLQLQSEGAEVFYRKPEVRPIAAIPARFLAEASVTPIDEEGFTKLFDASLLGGWTQSGPGRFEVDRGTATARGGMGLWYYKEKMYGNFILKGEYVQEEEGADSGVFVRFPDPGNDPWVAVHKGYEIEIGENRPFAGGTGSIYSFQAPTHLPINPPGRWNHYEIACIGQSYQVRLNGRLITSYRGSRGLKGFVGLQNYDDGKTFRHRNLRIRELPASAAAYSVLFEGDPGGWKMSGQGSFDPKDGTLIAHGPGLLWHEKPLRDFILMFEWKSESPQGGPGLLLRFPGPGPDPSLALERGQRIRIGGHIPLEAGRWNHCEVAAVGQEYVVRLNGRRVSDFTGDRSLEGHAGIEVRHPDSPVSLREIRLVELGKPD